MKFKLEICSGSVESAVNAQLAGADRKDIPMAGIKGIPEFSRKVADREKIINIINILKMI